MRQAMAHRDPSSPTPMPTILRYGIAVLSVAIAIGLCFFLLQHFEAKLTPFLFAVAATVWYAGTGPGVLAIVLSVLSLNHFFLRPSFSFGPISYADLVYLTFCTFCALAVGWVSAVRRRAEQALRQAREELEAKVVERTANLQRSEGYLAPDRHDEELGILKRIRRGELIKPYETVRMREDGSLLDLSVTVSPLRDAAGRIIGASKIARDVTERKRAEAALRDMQMELAHANRVATMGQLSASITHEVKQPIGAARNNARAALKFMDKNPPDLGEVRELLGCIVGNA